MNPIDTNRIANALERIAHALEHLNIENIEHAHIDDVGELHGGESYYKQHD
tara:strand:- start:850 stop:1002 length:153 start_codon:yes stop_codon:yes gene_type:complete